jgi:hypothetical protein
LNTISRLAIRAQPVIIPITAHLYPIPRRHCIA